MKLLTPTQAKKQLKAKGWSYRRAAPVLKVHYVHLARVLNEKRDSKDLLKRISKLPLAPNK